MNDSQASGLEVQLGNGYRQASTQGSQGTDTSKLLKRVQDGLELGPLEPPYRSRGEAQVGRLLDRYGLPFFYEQPTLIYDRGRYKVWHPDFSIPSLSGLIVEYAGMPDVLDYRAGIQHKQRAYRANGLPAMFVYPEHLRGPSWPEKLIERIYRAGQKGTSGYR